MGEGVELRPERFCEVATRKFYPLSSDPDYEIVTLYVASLTDEEIQEIEKDVKVKTLRELLLINEVDWATLGMILNGISVNGCR